MTSLTPKQQIAAAIQELPDEAIVELTHFVAYLQYKATHSQTLAPSSPDAIAPLSTDTAYEVWLPIDAPEAANTLMNLLAEAQS
jgi:hypothetical protein